MAEIGHVIPREAQKKVLITFPDGKVICYKRVVNTFIETIKKIGPERVASLGMEVAASPVGVPGKERLVQGQIQACRR